MILECDDCRTRYIVPDHAIGAEGRRVRCKNCGYEWFQRGVETDSGDDSSGEEDFSSLLQNQAHADEPEEEIEIEPIPDSVKPVPEGSELPTIPETPSQSNQNLKGVYFGYGAAAAIFFIFLSGFILSHKLVVELWPSSFAFYERVGVDAKVKGENLIFEKLEAVVDKDKHGVNMLSVDAKILNLSPKSENVPNVQVSLISEEGVAIDRWLVKPEEKVLANLAELAFRTNYPDIGKDVKEVNVRFIHGTDLEEISGKSKAQADNLENGDNDSDLLEDNSSGLAPESGTFLGKF